jgi:hypothetical protein
MIRVPVLLALLGVAASQLRGGPTVDLRMSQQTAIKGKVSAPVQKPPLRLHMRKLSNAVP